MQNQNTQWVWGPLERNEIPVLEDAMMSPSITHEFRAFHMEDENSHPTVSDPEALGPDEHRELVEVFLVSLEKNPGCTSA
jgi:hypothetical protein